MMQKREKTNNIPEIVYEKNSHQFMQWNSFIHSLTQHERFALK